MTGKRVCQSLKCMNSITNIFKAPKPERVLALAPSILSADFGNLEADLRRMMKKKIYWTHVDVMDGHFVPNISIGPPVVKSISAISTRLFLDTHLMISEPLKYLDAFVDAGADLITIHAETVDNLPHAIDVIRRSGVRVGVSIKPRTPVKVLEPILDKIDMVLVMTVEPGFGGQSIISSTLSKVRQLAQLRQKKEIKFLIEVDGGIDAKTCGMAIAAGANILVAGSAVFGDSPRIGKRIDTIIDAMEKA